MTDETVDKRAREMAASAEKKASEAVTIVERIGARHGAELESLQRTLDAHTRSLEDHRRDASEANGKVIAKIDAMENRVHDRINDEVKTLKRADADSEGRSIERDVAISNRFWGLLVALLLMALGAVGALLAIIIG